MKLKGLIIKSNIESEHINIIFPTFSIAIVVSSIIVPPTASAGGPLPAMPLTGAPIMPIPPSHAAGGMFVFGPTYFLLYPSCLFLFLEWSLRLHVCDCSICQPCSRAYCYSST